MSSMIFGWVSVSRSLLPRTSRGQVLKRAPRYPASSSLWRWIMVPMAPSSTTMRCSRSRRRAAMRSVRVVMGSGGGTRARRARAHTECVADRVAELGAIQRVEVELIDAVALQGMHLLDRDARRDQAARFRVVVESVE